MSLIVPYAFVQENQVRLTWQEVLLGLQLGLFDPRAPVEFASDLLAEGDDRPEVLKLAASDREDPIVPSVEAMAHATPAEIDPHRVWAFLRMAWLHSHQDAVEDPLEEVERIYQDCEYPERLAPMVRYMPPKGPGPGSPEKLFAHWSDYLLAERSFFAKRSGLPLPFEVSSTEQV